MPKLGSLNFVFKGDQESKHAFIVMHGYGADMNDLASIGEWLSPKVGGAWYFLQAPLEVDIGPYMTGRAWFPIDMIKLQHASMTGDFASLFEKGLPSGIDEAATSIKDVIEILKNRHEKIHLAGFSQGSMMAGKCAFENKDDIQSLSMLSGVLVSKSLWEEKTKEGIHFPTFQSHGTHDPVLPISEARKLKDFLVSHNKQHRYVEFSGGHEIPMPILNAWQKFIEEATL